MMLVMVTSPIESFFMRFPRPFGALQIRMAANWLPHLHLFTAET
jgi:hypothetical protein